jgi:hypothetical protein
MVMNTQLAYVDVRRSTRIDHAVSLMVHGFDLARSPYQERVSTVAVNYHGCRYRTKHEMLRGDVVFLVINQPDEDHTVFSTRARVKWLQASKMDGDHVYEVAVELEAPGNIWGISSPPSDWANISAPAALEAHNSNRNLRMLARPEPTLATPNQLVEGLGEYIQRMASDSTSAALTRETGHLIEEFREQLQHEASRTLQQVLAATREEFAIRVMKDLAEAHETDARKIYERWISKIERDTGSATMRIATHGAAVSERVESMAVSTIEQMQRNMDASRKDAVDHCLTRLRTELVPLLEEVQTALDKLAASEDEIKIKSLTICEQFAEFLDQEKEKSAAEMQETLSVLEKQFETSLNERLANAQEQLTNKCALAFDGSNEALLKVFGEYEQQARNKLESLVTASTDRAADTLKGRTEEIAHRCSTELEDYTRTHLEFVSESIAAIARKKPVRNDRSQS